MQKLFLGIIIIIFLLVTVNALTVTDIQTDVNQSNTQVLQKNIEILAQIQSIKNQINTMQNQNDLFQGQALLKADLPEMYGTINEIARANNINILVSVIVVAIASFCFGFIAKSRGWL